ncbi:FAD-dependent oxidoreductase [Sphaerochaeta sp.]|jgi:hypothetical protein|uniref:FAD-dependent oxidoreductase n=1 Tax=Sphaerochaeta sp. TaxID=1972642 RepID=UPI002A35C6C4|nr:FAD-dependent oxidoreductase [Sphaerochaeta sp.]MDX9985145.1 FAD-dependent oxidoreductase [Sphaerochaeta sp.]
MNTWKTVVHETQLCVVGGGLAGVMCAISAARRGAKVVLIQDRPMLGGNSSSEIRMQVRGAHGLENKETGILSELELEAIYRNPRMNPNIWDGIIYEKVKQEKNITLLLNTTCIDAEMAGDSIQSVRCWQLTTYSWHVVHAYLFADCSGDSVLSIPTGAIYRLGRESADEFGESMGVPVADTKTMGMSILIQARELDHPVDFIAPSWAYVYEDEAFATIAYDQYHSGHRDHALGTDGCNFWWIELGGNQQVLDDAENIRDELLKTAYGVWDHIKNYGDHQAENWELDWIGFLPGKRESRRYVGPYILTQNDIQSDRKFVDVVGYGGWPLDDHNPMGFLNRGEAHEKSQFLPTPSPYEIPFSSLYSVNVSNLMFAGRNISATHAAMSSTRVMATCSILGQAVGLAASMCYAKQCLPSELASWNIHELQQALLEDYCFLPGKTRMIPELTLRANHNLSPDDAAILYDGMERFCADGRDHYIQFKSGQSITYSFEYPEEVKKLRIVFDLDFSRESITQFKRIQKYAMRSHIGRDFKPVKMPKNMAKEFVVEIDEGDGKWQNIYTTNVNHVDLFTLRIDRAIKQIRVVFQSAYADEFINVYACDIS